MRTRLIHINGLPGLGKTTLGHAYAHGRPLTLVVDIDQLRTQLGGWQDRIESQLIARDLALVLIAAHLGSGHDAVVPQFLGKLEFIERLEAAANDAGADFVEIMLAADPSVAANRFWQRRAQLQAEPGLHPEVDVADAHVDTVIGDAANALAEVRAARPSICLVDADGDISEVHARLIAVLESASPQAD